MSDEIAAIRAREAAATPGPWDGYWGRDERPVIVGPGMCIIAQHVRPADVEFIILTRTAVPALLAAHDAVLADNARLRAGLEGLRREHELVSYSSEYMSLCGAEHGHCECGADEWNAKIDALLAGA